MAKTRKQPPSYRKARRLAKKLGCEITIEHMGDYRNYWVCGPLAVYGEPSWRVDPREGDHCCIDWDEVFDAVCDYSQDLEEFAHIIPEPGRAMFWEMLAGTSVTLADWILEHATDNEDLMCLRAGIILNVLRMIPD